MINFNKYIAKPYYDPEEIHTYGDAVRFAYSVFNFFNGKVNPHFYAHAMVLGTDIRRISTFGEAVGDIVVLYMHHIMYCIDKVETENKSSKLKGHIISSIIHELLHMEQDIGWYYNKYKNDNTAKIKLEEACHAMTDNYIRNLIQTGIINLDYEFATNAEIAPLSDYFKYGIDKINKLRMDADKIFKRIDNPSHKAIWVLEQCILPPGANLYDIPRFVDSASSKPASSIYARLSVNGNIIKENYVLYNGILGSKDAIMDITRTIILITTAFKNRPDTSIDIIITELDGYSGVYIIDVLIKVDSSTAYMNIVDKVNLNLTTPYV